jgi:exopolysaccharide biosynthesis protein
MRKPYKIHLLIALSLLVFSDLIFGQVRGFENIRWEREKIAAGLILESAHAFLNDTIPQNINILKVNLKRRKISLIHNPVKNVPVSMQAGNTSAIAAVNAGFFNIKTGGSVTYLRAAGIISDPDTAVKWIRNANMNGAVLIRRSERLFIGRRMQNSWYDMHNEFEDILVTGPLLTEHGKKSVLPATSLAASRHPRTAIGIRNKRKVVLITVDGRAIESAGMTLDELADVFLILKCREAVNLDGGGSTTMWIKGKPFNGVVNMPSDNRKFDHEGERPVANVLIIK